MVASRPPERQPRRVPASGPGQQSLSGGRTWWWCTASRLPLAVSAGTAFAPAPAATTAASDRQGATIERLAKFRDGPRVSTASRPFCKRRLRHKKAQAKKSVPESKHCTQFAWCDDENERFHRLATCPRRRAHPCPMPSPRTISVLVRRHAGRCKVWRLAAGAGHKHVCRFCRQPARGSVRPAPPRARPFPGTPPMLQRKPHAAHFRAHSTPSKSASMTVMLLCL